MSSVVSKTLEKEVDLCAPEREQAMLRARQRARAFVNPSVQAPEKPFVPPLVRNKSNEQIKSSLKVRPGLVRANSEPSQKSVHFSSTNLEDIRPFRRSQSPSAVSRRPRFFYGTTTIRNGDEDALRWEYSDDDDDDEDEDEEDEEFDDDQRHDFLKRNRRDTCKHWTLLTPGFSPHAMGRLGAAHRPNVYLDNVQLTADQHALKAIVYVRNLSFQKYVALRYTINDWKSFVESQGTWSADIRKFDRDAGYDRFDITVPLDQFPEDVLNTRALQACVRYSATGAEESWDNNGGKNYEFYLRNPRLASNIAEAPTASRNSPPPSHSIGSRSMPNMVHETLSSPDLASQGAGRSHDREVSEDDSEGSADFFGISSADYLKRVGVRVRNNDDEKKNDPFFGRYSFAASYKASPKKPPVSHDDAPVFIVDHGRLAPEHPTELLPTAVSAMSQTKPEAKPTLTTSLPVTRASGGTTDNTCVSPGDLSPADISPADIWESDSYKDFVSRYCFFTPNYLDKPKEPPRAPEHTRLSGIVTPSKSLNHT